MFSLHSIASLGLSCALVIGCGGRTVDDAGQAPTVGDWFVSGGARQAYTIEVDPDAPRDGHPTLALAAYRDPKQAYGTMMQTRDPTGYVGHRVRISLYVRTSGATERRDFWARVQAPTSPGDGMGLGGPMLTLPRDSDFALYTLELDVPEGGSMLQFGVGLAGPGEIWVDGLETDTTR